MRKIIYLLPLLFSSVFLHAQTPVGQPGGSFFPFFSCNDDCAAMSIPGTGAVVKGMAFYPSGFSNGYIFGGYTEIAGNKDFFVIKMASGGNQETIFGGVNGRVTTDLGNVDDEAWGMVVQPNGKIILAGFSGSDFAVVRYNELGDLDNTFGGDGIVATDIGSGSIDNGLCVALQPDGKILVAGISTASGGGDFTVVRYNADGSIDNTFGGGDGKVTTDIGTNTVDIPFSIKVQPDGRILVAGATGAGTIDDITSTNIAVVRYNADGTLDTGFSGDGKLTTNVGPIDFATQVAVQADGKVVVGGYTGTGSYPGTNRDFLLIRYSAAGIPDATFDSDGIVTTNFGNDEPAYAMILQADGKILLGGTNGGEDFLVARYTSTGGLDPVFDTDGWNTFNAGNNNADNVAAALLIDFVDEFDATIYVGGSANNDAGVAGIIGDAGPLTLLPAGASLPLNLLSFTAQKQSSNIQLQWQTEREENIAGFNIQRSADGRIFNTLGYAQPITTTGVIKKNYSYVDNSPLSAVNYYRLAIKDLDGSVTYSKILAIKNNNVSQQLEIFPNPLPAGSGVLQVQLPGGLRGRTSLQISDVTGRIVRTMTFETGGNALSTSVDVSTLTKGFYMVRVKSGNNISMTTKFLKN